MISLVTVSFKSLDYVEKMLASLFAHVRRDDMEVFVVVNGDGTDPSRLQAEFPRVRFIVSETNLGFAGGSNLAIKEATGEFVILVNPDVVFTSDAVTAIEERMRGDASVGIGGISLRNPDGSQQLCVWKFPTPVDQLLLMLKVPHLLPNLPPLRRYWMRDFDYRSTANVDQVMGAFFCIRRAVIDKIGMLDDGFFVWYEEVDYCRRAKNAGWDTRYYGDVSALHKGGGSFDRVATLRKQTMMRQSMRRYMWKHYGIGVWLLFTLLNPIFIALAYVASLIKPM
ncbi:glycosyltransferase family 2 protein [bacterium]|nr:glycosyltransferase family 2 protein [bacterium]